MDDSSGISNDLFDRFERIPFHQLIGEQQMNRIDTKFPFHISNWPMY